MPPAADAVRVLLTRAEADCLTTAARVEAMGFRTLVSPLIETRATAHPPPPGPWDALLITSAKAAAALARLGPAPVFAVGERTAAAARAAGASDVRSADGGARELAALVRETLAPGARLLHVAGVDHKPEPRASLLAAGYEVEVWNAYVAAARPLSADARAALTAGEIDAVLHYSRRASTLFLEALAQAGLSDRVPTLVHGALSDDAAKPLREAGAVHVVSPETPRESALLRVFAHAISVADGANARAAR